MKAVILAGGLGTRLKPFSQVIPKPLLPLGESSLMEIEITNLKRCGFDEIFVATNYKSEIVEAVLGDGSKWGVNLTISREENPLGTCGPLTLLKEYLTETFLVVNGDILTRLDFGKMMQHAMKQSTVLTVGTKIITLPFRFGNVVINELNHITKVEEKPDLHFEIIAGIYCMNPGVFEFIPENQYFGVDQLIKKMLSESKPISRYLIHDYWLDIGQVEDYEKARQEYDSNF